MATILDLAQKMLRGEVPPPPIGRLLGLPSLRCEPCRNKFFSIRPLKNPAPSERDATEDRQRVA